MKTLRNDNRAQSYTYIVAGCMVVLGAGLIMVFGDALTDLLSFADDQCTTASCSEGVTNVQAVWDWFPLVVAGFVFIMIIATSIYQSRRPTR